ncbi:class I SAM-dependent methyltransferase [Flammeovirgaceae bacterium SG7u.111]|nr:class I SAM-dependent methyltransferase [Flammeovirgaceae bacterium SG7u.132]WPO38247.1 class I SAM-dependent methyltransferase [Flammeovirgaceae bacterium SG7u.111]
MENIFDIESPITGKKDVSICEELSVKKIIDEYKKIGLDVTNNYTGISSIKILKCNESGYRFYYPYSTIGDKNFYVELAEREAYYPEIRWEHKLTINFISKEDKVLEIGSGFGAFLNLLKTKNIEGTGLELNPAAIENCSKQGLDIRNELSDAHLVNNHEKYDVVCFFQVLEHVYDVKGFLDAALGLLKPNGKLYIAVPNSNPYLYKYDKFHAMNLPPHHAGLWDKDTLSRLQDHYNITLDELKVEPLHVNVNEYWDAMYEESKSIKNNYFLTFLFNATKPIRKVYARNFIEGRNLLAVYTKKTQPTISSSSR